MATNTSADEVDSFIKMWADHVLSEPPESVDPDTATDAETVIRSQLTENTGRHILDSGGAYGRNFEENRENPPWEKPTYQVHGDGADGYVVKNLYDHMSETFSRDRLCVALETALYAFGRSEENKRDGWLTSMKEFGEWVGHGYEEDFEEFGLDETTAARLAGVGYNHHVSWNTYNSEFGSLTQCLQGVTVNPESRNFTKYELVQVHGGTDIRGGYTGPRVYKNEYGSMVPYPVEGSVQCQPCGWSEAESCLYDHQYGDKEQLVVYDGDENETRCAKCGGEVHFAI